MRAVAIILALLCSFADAANKRGHHEQQNTLKEGGTSFANRTVWASMILTDPMVADVLGRDFNRVPQGVNGTPSQNAWLRISNAKKMTKDLPFPVEFWYSIFTQSCPERKTKGNDRGVAMAHQQIWADFEYRGRKGIDKHVAKDDDVIIVFEDDAVIVPKDIRKSLEGELSRMKTDLLFLGWCYGRRHMPMCTHAYALSRAGARKILAEWDPCSTFSIDGQWHQMVRNGLFTWDKARPESYADAKPGLEDNPNYFTRGVFIQKGGLVSFNHHGFQNNANG
jgi:hypothetical protein